MLHRAQSVEEELARKKKGSEDEEMTEEAKLAIISSKFDFTTLEGCVGDIRKGFWNVESVNNYYKKKIRQTHSHFYQ